jgi:hypothetical protein
MPRYCSTRDGRTRAPAPTAPHLTWTASIPITDGSHALAEAILTTDASGHAYVASAGGFGGNPQLQRIDTGSGASDWTNTTAGSPTALLLSAGAIELTVGDPLAEESLDPGSGATSPLGTLGYWGSTGDPAIGADGSLYYAYMLDQGTATATTRVSGVSRAGAVEWTSVDLATLGPPPVYGDVDPSELALGLDGAVLVAINVLTSAETFQVVAALAPDTGAVRWTRTVPGQMLGGPIVAADGSILIAVDEPRPGAIVVLEATGDVRSTLKIPDAPSGSATIFGLPAVGLDGTILASSDVGQGVDGLVAFSQTGAVLWHQPLQLLEATITSDGAVLAHDSFDLTLLDLATGATRWVLSPPHPSVCIAAAELTSTGGIVGLQCDGTLFGAGD